MIALKWLSLPTLVAMIALSGGSHRANAGAIPYPNVGTQNPVTYRFTASTTGDVTAYFAGSGAAYDEKIGMLDNGVLDTGGFGLDDHASSVGQSFDFGHVTAGDILVFVLDVVSPALGFVYSDPSMNAAYDSPGDTVGHNHVYSTSYTGSPPYTGIPNGTYVAFEDLPFPGSDFNYFDETYVFTNVRTTTNVPEPKSLVILGVGLIGLGLARRRQFDVCRKLPCGPAS